MLENTRIAVLGLGKMSQTIIGGLLRDGGVRDGDIVATERTRASAETHGAAPIVRAMPNTPCFIGKGMTVLSRGPRAADAHLQMARRVFEPLGRVRELDEHHMDTVTGLTASGPAFIYLIIEALADGGVMRGLPREVATELVAQMTLGASEMVLAPGGEGGGGTGS